MITIGRFGFALLVGATLVGVSPENPKVHAADASEPEVDGSASLSLTLEQCLELNAQYVDALPDAHLCNPHLGELQCTQLVATRLTCPCLTVVNPMNKDTLDLLEDISKRWSEGGCQGMFECGEYFCPPIGTTLCTPSVATERHGPLSGECGRFWNH